MKLKVKPGIQVKHAGKMYTGGDTFDASAAEAADLVRRGYVTETKAVAGSANKAVTESPNKGFLGTRTTPAPVKKSPVKKAAKK